MLFWDPDGLRVSCQHPIIGWFNKAGDFFELISLKHLAVGAWTGVKNTAEGTWDGAVELLRLQNHQLTYASAFWGGDPAEVQALLASPEYFNPEAIDQMIAFLTSPDAMAEVYKHYSALPATRKQEIIGEGATYFILAIATQQVGSKVGKKLMGPTVPVPDASNIQTMEEMLAPFRTKAQTILEDTRKKWPAAEGMVMQSADFLKRKGLRLLRADSKELRNAKNVVYRAITEDDLQNILTGKGLFAKAPNGEWSAVEHIANQSRAFPLGGAAKNSPWISTTADLEIARAFDVQGGHGVIAIDLDKMNNYSVRVWEHVGRYSSVQSPPLNIAETLAYHRSIWTREVTVFQSIPLDAILGFVK